MIERIVTLAVARRWLVLLLTVIVAAIGAFSLYRLPIDGRNVQQNELELPGWAVRELLVTAQIGKCGRIFAMFDAVAPEVVSAIIAVAPTSSATATAAREMALRLLPSTPTGVCSTLFTGQFS